MKKFVSKNQIIDAAINIAGEKGWEKTTVREIAKEINYSTIKIYSEFKSKEDLLKAIQIQGFMMLKSEYLKSIQFIDQREEKLIELTLAHYRFSHQQKTYYDLMFQMDGSTCSLPKEGVLANAGEPINQLLSDVAGYKVDKPLFLHWWSLAHGFIAITRMMGDNEENNNRILRALMTKFIKGIKG